MQRIQFKLFFIFFFLIILSSCGGGKKSGSEQTTNNEQKTSINVPDFNQDSAYKSIQQQLAFGPRVPNTVAHDKCAEYFKNKLKEYTPDVIIQTAKVRGYDGTMLNMKNVIASFKPELTDRIFICSHWDSRPWADKDEDPANRKKPVPAANDGASGCAVMLEIARLLHTTQPKIGVDLIFLDDEDYGNYNDEDSWGLGSQYWAKNPQKQNYTARFGILLDMVGARNAVFTMEESSMHYASDIMRKVWDIAGRNGYSDYFSSEKTSPITDDHVFINKYLNVPTIDIIHYDPSLNTGFFKYWHTTKDDINCIDKQTLKAVGQTLLYVIYGEN